MSDKGNYSDDEDDYEEEESAIWRIAVRDISLVQILQNKTKLTIENRDSSLHPFALCSPRKPGKHI